MSDKDSKDKPLCYGLIEEVFPMGEDGLRHSPERCMACPHKTPCLRAALTRDPAADEVKGERVDRAYEAGNISFLSRWAQRKSLAKRKGKSAVKKGGE